MLDCAAQYASAWQFRFNTKAGKSDVVIVPHDEELAQSARFYLGPSVEELSQQDRDRFRLHVSREYKYLGVEMGRTGKGCWNSYLHRVRRKAMSAMNQLLYSVSGRSWLRLETCLHLFKTLVRPVLEYADGVWGAMCSAAGLQLLEQVQERFCRRLLRLPSNVSGVYVRAELGLPSMCERTRCAAYRFFGKMAMLCKQRRPGGGGPVRLAAYVFEQRCEAVDRRADWPDREQPHSWCAEMKSMLESAAWSKDVWQAKAVPDDWNKRLRKNLQQQFRAEADLRMAGMSSLAVFRQMRTKPDLLWLERCNSHSGAALRLKLRCGAAPLMERVGASMKIPRERRTCLMCSSGAVENAEHFACRCPYYDRLRDECVARIEAKLGDHQAPALRRALGVRDPTVFLGNQLWTELPPELAQAVDTTVCDFLKVAWRRRQPIWSAVCVEGSEWRLA